MVHVNEEKLFEVLKNDLIITTDKPLQSVVDSLAKEIVDSLVILEMKLNNTGSGDQLSILCEKDIDILSESYNGILCMSD